jgi:hypothetical protein
MKWFGVFASITLLLELFINYSKSKDRSFVGKIVSDMSTDMCSSFSDMSDGNAYIQYMEASIIESIVYL